MAITRESADYYWLSKYDILETTDEEFLIFKKKTVSDPTVRIVPLEKYFDILTEVHKAVGHGGREKIMYNIKSKMYIPKKAIELFVKLCSVCELKRSLPKKGIVTKPLISKDFNSRGQVDLIDLQSAPDGEYKWLMNYQDHATKFLHLRPLQSKRAVEVALELLKIFLEFGAPFILQSDNGKEFTARVIEEIVKLWPECTIVHGSPRRPQTQGSVERSNQDVENMLRCWLHDNHSTNWSVGCFFVQYCKNSSFHRIIGRSPYRALFGSDPKTVLKGTYIPDSVLASIQKEQELNNPGGTETEVPIQPPNEDMAPVEGLSVVNETQFIEVLDLDDTLKESCSGIASASDLMNSDTGVIKPVEVLGTEIDEIKAIHALDKQICLVCANETTEAHTCKSCSRPVHAICGLSNGKEGFGSQILCFLCKSEHDISIEREQAHKGVKRAAENMIDRTAKKHSVLEIGNSVILNVPKLDRGPLDTKNISGKVVDMRNGVFKIGTSSGTIKNWFPRQELQVSATNYNEEISESPITLRHAVTRQSMFGGQGFQKCSCKPAKNQCYSNRCACFKNKLLCTSKCHHSLSCINK